MAYGEKVYGEIGYGGNGIVAVVERKSFLNERTLNQTAVYWASPVEDGYGGFTWDAPVEISCRWEDTLNVAKAGDGDEFVSSAIVFVKQELDEQGMLFLGALIDLDSTEEADPTSVAGAYLIKRFDKIPNIKATEFLYKAYL